MTIHIDPPESALIWRLLSPAYRSALRLADEAGCRSVALPSISTGIFGYPVQEAARVAIFTVRAEMKSLKSVSLVRFCLLSEADLAAHRQAAER